MDVDIWFKDGRKRSFSGVAWAGREHGLMVVRTNNWDDKGRYKTCYPIEEVEAFISRESMEIKVDPPLPEPITGCTP